MTTVWITEAAGAVVTSGGHVTQALVAPFYGHYKVAYDTDGPIFDERTKAIRIVSDGDFWGDIDKAPAPAVDAGIRGSAEKEEVFGVGQVGLRWRATARV